MMPTVKIAAMSILLSTSLITACKSAAVKAQTSAVIVNPTDESRAELRQVVTDALQSVEVTLADDALTRGNILIIDRKPIKDARGNLIQGRELGMPEQFQLFIADGNCILEQSNSGKRWRLEETDCKAFEQ